jgi:hypothetical protein
MVSNLIVSVDLNLALPISFMILRFGDVRIGEEDVLMLMVLLYGVEGFAFYNQKEFLLVSSWEMEPLLQTIYIIFNRLRWCR